MLPLLTHRQSGMHTILLHNKFQEAVLSLSSIAPTMASSPSASFPLLVCVTLTPMPQLL